jgi:phenylalanyl-tRNA synthetase beta chain
MKISLEWLSDYVDLPANLAIHQIMHDLTMSTVEVESAHDLAANLANVVVGQIKFLEPIKEHSKPMRVLCDIGGKQPVSIICGAGNLSAGMKLAIALPGAKIHPHGAADAIEVKSTQVAGVQSDAIICAANEIGLSELYAPAREDFIVDLSDIAAAPGVPLSKAIGWEDTILEIDNKSLTHRPDLWGHYGIAREFAAIYGCTLKPLTTPDRNFAAEKLIEQSDPAGCNRFTATHFSNAENTVSPFWLRSRLARIGQRSINLFADLTNYVMLATGQPTHVYDASEITLPLSARFSRAEETILLLNDETLKLDPSTLAIVDKKGPIGLAGIMGGKTTGVKAETHEFVLEICNFNTTTIRRASKRLSIRTEASARFEKGLDTQRIDLALNLFIELVQTIQPSARIAGFQDLLNSATTSKTIESNLVFLQDRLGKKLSMQEVSDKLTSLGFDVKENSGAFKVIVPTWRSTGDVSRPEDLVEEVARLYGYDNFEFVPPTIILEKATISQTKLFERRLREQTAQIGGMQEVVTYPWVKDKFLEAAGFEKATTIRFDGAPSPDQDSLRPSLIPNLLESVVTNLRYFPSFRIFEMGAVFPVDKGGARADQKESQPIEPHRIAGAFVGQDAFALFQEAKGLLEELRRTSHIISLNFGSKTNARWADNSARVGLAVHDQEVGAIGLITNRAKRLAGIKRGQVVCFELDLARLQVHPSRENKYERLPEVPQVDFDLSLIFSNEVTWKDISSTAAGVNSLIREITFVDQFRGGDIPSSKKSITLRVRLGHPDRTLRSEEIAEVRESIAARLKDTFQAELRG